MTNNKKRLAKIRSDLKRGFYLPENPRHWIGDDMHFLCTLPQKEWGRSKPADLVRGILVAMIENIEVEGDVTATVTEDEISYYVKLVDKTREMTFGIGSTTGEVRVTPLNKATATTLAHYYNILMQMTTKLSGLLRPGTIGPTDPLITRVTKIEVGG